MERARIKVNTERAKAALQKIHEKHDRPTQERMMYKLFIKEVWVDSDKTELDIIVKNKLIQRGLNPSDFIREIHFDFAKYNIPRNEYKVEAE